ncbi:hypothetical protein, conserved [Eimeria maxima]|uniref:Myosin heavy chain n=1 Tax=Eimeria maxima TaxID=5804 RepID=U6M9X6_EIMMA|nr:hypothetical protein, conserved [Eimeria maxima]CDJ58460.1 hypothetical protein, conserved [Eimeria maxima]
MWKHNLHVSLVVLAGIVSLSLCDASDLNSASNTVETPAYLPYVDHTQRLRTHLPRSIPFPVPKTPQSQRLLRLLASYAAASALVFLILSCFLTFESFRNTNSHNRGRSLAEKYDEKSCHDDADTGEFVVGTVDRRALHAVHSQLAYLNVPETARQHLNRSEHQLVSTAKSVLLGYHKRLTTLLNGVAEANTPEANTALMEIDHIRAVLGSIAWSPSQNIQALLHRATAYSEGRQVPHAVSAAVAAAVRVNDPNKNMPITITEEQQQLVCEMVKGIQTEMSRAIDALQNERTPHPSVLETARTLLGEQEPLRLQLNTVGMAEVSAELARVSEYLRGALTHCMNRKPRRTASMPSRFATLSLSQHREQAAPAAKGAQALLQPTSSFSSLPPKGPKGAKGPCSRGPHQKAHALSEEPRSSTLLRRRGSENKGSTLPRSTQTEEDSPRGAGVGPETQPIDVEKTRRLTSAVNQWTDKCRGSLQMLLSGTAREESLEKVALNGHHLYREVTSATVDSSVDGATSRAFWESVDTLSVALNSLHSELIRSWLDKVADSRHRLTKARYNLQASVNELSADNPPRAGGMCIGDMSVVRATVDATKRLLGDLSRFLGVSNTHQRLSDAIEGLRSTVARAEKELQEAIDSVCRIWRRALENEVEGRPAVSPPHTSSDASATRHSTSSNVPLLACARGTVQVLQQLGGQSVELDLLLQFFDRQGRGSSKKRSGLFRAFSLRRGRSSSGSRTTSSLPKET